MKFYPQIDTELFIQEKGSQGRNKISIDFTVIGVKPEEQGEIIIGLRKLLKDNGELIHFKPERLTQDYVDNPLGIIKTAPNPYCFKISFCLETHLNIYPLFRKITKFIVK